MVKFKTSDEFFDWFLSDVIEKHYPNYRTLVANDESTAPIVDALPTLTPDEIDFMFEEIRKVVKVPHNVFLVYDNKIKTYASRYNTGNRRLEIICPTYAYYHLRYDPIIKAAMQHELGHILNRDYKFNMKGHSGCANRCMDIRINHHINREWLRDLFDGVYYFRAKKGFTMLVPEETLENYGLRLKRHGTYSFQQIHKYYHLNDSDKREKGKKVYNLPKVGDIIRINKTKQYRKVTGITDDKVESVPMTNEEVKEHFKEVKSGGAYSSIGD